MQITHVSDYQWALLIFVVWVHKHANDDGRTRESHSSFPPEQTSRRH
jgi:hypothetical protein